MGVVTVVPMRISLQSAMDLRIRSQVNQEALFAILRLFLLPSMAKYYSGIL
jgi:hypothetical protein